MRILCFAIVAFVVVHKLCASAETKWESFMSRIRTEPRSRTNPMRRGAPMQTQIVPTNLDPEQAWGVEALDPLQQRAWAEVLWQRWYRDSKSRKPLLLLYEAGAERAAMRVLNTFARLSRLEECAPWVVLVESRSAIMLAPPVPALSLYLAHRASRFANVKEWLEQTANNSACRVVLTAPMAEGSMLREFADFEVVEIPAEEPSYCEAVANELVAKYFGETTPLSGLERILLSAGCAEIALPMSLLERKLQCEPAALRETLERSRLRELVLLSPETNSVSFRGAWLARKLFPEPQGVEYEALFELVEPVAVESRCERNFLLQLMLALRAQGKAERWLEPHAEILRRARQCANEGEEAPAWEYVTKLDEHMPSMN